MRLIANTFVFASLGMAALLTRLLLLSLVLLLTSVQAPALAQTVSIGVVADNEPYSGYGPSGIQGFSIDVLDEVSRRSGVEFNFRLGSWPEIYGAFLRGEIDAVDEISWREDRAEKMLFTRPYHVRKTVVMHDANRPIKPVTQMDDLRDMRVGVLRDVFYADLLRSAGLDLHQYSLQSDLVRALAFGWVDAIIGSEVTLQYFARAQGFANLKVVSNAPLDGGKGEDFRIAVHLNMPELHRKLDDALARIDPAWIANVQERWQEYGGKSLQAPTFTLTQAQQATVRQSQPVRVGLMRDYAPLSFEEGGQVRGLAVDVLSRVLELTGLRSVPVVGQWEELVEMFKRGEIDLMTNISDLPARRAFARFTDPYHFVAVVGFTHSPTLRLRSADDLAGLRVGYPGGIFYENKLKEYLGQNAIPFGDQASMFHALAGGQVDLVLGVLENGNHWIRELGLKDIYVAGDLNLDGIVSEDLRFAVRPALEPLVPIINQALDSITPTERRVIENRWLGAQIPNPSSLPDPVRLTEAERAVLAQKKDRLKFCAHPDWLPLDGVTNGRHAGLASAMLAYFASQLPVSFDLHATSSWQESLSALEAGRCDFLPAAPTSLRGSEKYLLTDAYYNLPTVVLGRIQSPFIGSLSDLGDSPIGVSGGDGFAADLAFRYPGLNIVTVESERQGLEKVRSGELYGYIGTLATTSQTLQELGLADIRVIGRVPGDTSIAMVTMSDQTVLAGLLRRLVTGVPNEDLTQMEATWVTVPYKDRLDYTLLWQIMAGTVLLLGLLFAWNRKLRALNRKLEIANRKLAEMGATDQLTGLGNRTMFEKEFALCFNAAQRGQNYFLVAMLDVDHFKKVNDTLGHAAGDECLRQFAQALKRTFRRGSDRLVRYGGEEFVIFACLDSQSGVHERLDDFRKSFGAQPIVFEGQEIALTISIGYCLSVPARESKAGDWLQAADKGLYSAKHHGRNRVCRCDTDGNVCDLEVGTQGQRQE